MSTRGGSALDDQGFAKANSGEWLKKLSKKETRSDLRYPVDLIYRRFGRSRPPSSESARTRCSCRNNAPSQQQIQIRTAIIVEEVSDKKTEESTRMRKEREKREKSDVILTVEEGNRLWELGDIGEIAAWPSRLLVQIRDQDGDREDPRRNWPQASVAGWLANRASVWAAELAPDISTEDHYLTRI